MAATVNGRLEGSVGILTRTIFEKDSRLHNSIAERQASVVIY